MKRQWMTGVILTAALMTGCGSKTVEQRPAAECKPIADYETYETIWVESMDEVPADCTSLLLTVSEVTPDSAFNYENEEQLYYEYDPMTVASYPRLDVFAYVVTVPEEDAVQAYQEAVQRPLKRLGLGSITMTDLDDLSRIQGLETLWMYCCEFEPAFEGDFSSLTDLQCSWCHINKLGDIVNIKTLQRLSLKGSKLKSLKGIEELTALSKLDLEYADMNNLKPLQTMTQLTSLNLNDIGSYKHKVTTDLRVLSGMSNLKTLGVNESRNLIHTEKLSELTGLEYLSAVSCKLDSVETLQPLTKMRLLDVRANSIADISPLSDMTELESLHLHNNQLGSIEDVRGLTHLKTLRVGYNDIIDISPAAELPELEYLSVSYAAHLSDITPIQGNQHLKTLDIRATNVTDTETISSLKQLETLWMSGTKISDVTFAAGLPQLRDLDIASTRTEDITPLYALKNLEKLDISTTRVKEIKGISSLKNLQELTMNATDITSIDELKGMSGLKKVSLENCGKLDREMVEQYQAEMEEREGKVSTNYH